jgi:hypothetical protein
VKTFSLKVLISLTRVLKKWPNPRRRVSVRWWLSGADGRTFSSSGPSRRRWNLAQISQLSLAIAGVFMMGSGGWQEFIPVLGNSAAPQT